MRRSRLFARNISIKKWFPLLCLTCFFAAVQSAQADENDWAWWNELHNWEPGMPSWKRYIIVSPGYLGPNALPVPEMKKGVVPLKSEISFSYSNHSLQGDPTQDLAAKIYVPFANGRIAVEVYGVLYEKYGYTEAIRNERFSRNKSGKGNAFGDIYFSTVIQVCRNQRFLPNTAIRMAARTTSGTDFDAARYSDTPGYFFDISMSKDFNIGKNFSIMPFGSVGFYSWQTNNDEILQNDAIMYGGGLDVKIYDFLLSGSFSGYSGYFDNRDRPQVITSSLRYDWKNFALSFEYLHGIRDWEYKTLRFTVAYKFRGVFSNNQL